MEPLVSPDSTATQQDGMALHTLVNRLVAGIVPATTRHNSFMVNDVPADLKISADTEMVATVLSNLFNTVATHTANSCIRITAKTCGNVILVELKDHHSASVYTIASSLQQIQPIAEKIGGYLGIATEKKNETTIVFSFPNKPAAA